MSILEAAENSLGEILSPFFSLSAPDYRGQDFPDGLSFQEYDSDGKPAGLPFILIGNQLPKDRFPWGGKQHVVKEFYPGNPEPSLQVLGGREDDIKLVGRFHDKRIQDPTRKLLYGAATAVAEALDEMRKKGSIVKMKLGEFVRYGMIEASNFKTRTLGDVEYEINFIVIGTTFPQNCKFLKTPLALPAIANTALIAAASKFSARAATIPDTMPLNLQGLLTSYISEVAAAVSAVTQFVDNVLTTAENAGKLYERALGLVRNARTSCAVFKRRVGTLALNAGNAPLAGSTAVNQALRAVNALFILETLHSTNRNPARETDDSRARAAALVANFTSKVNTAEAAKATKGGNSIESLLRDMQKQLEALSRTVPMRRVRVKEGDTLQKYASTYYGDPTLWDRIYAHNKLTSTLLVVGKVIEIPRL